MNNYERLLWLVGPPVIVLFILILALWLMNRMRIMYHYIGLDYRELLHQFETKENRFATKEEQDVLWVQAKKDYKRRK